MWPNPQETADLVTFTEEILDGKFHFLCSDRTDSRGLRVCSNHIDLSVIYSEPYQTSKTEYAVKIVNGLKPLIIVAKSFILDVWQGSEYGT